MRHYLLSLLLVGLLATPGWAAVTIDTDTGSKADPGSSTSHSHVIAANANAILVLVKTQDGGNVNTSISTVTVGGQAATLVSGCSATINNQHRSEIYYLLSPPTGSQTVAVTANAAVDQMATIAVSLRGVALTSTFNTCGTATGTGTSNVDIDSLASAVGELAFMTLGDNDGRTCAADATAPVSTEIREVNVAPNTSNCAYYEAGAASTINMRVDLSSTSNWTATAVSVRAAANRAVSPIILQ